VSASFSVVRLTNYLQSAREEIRRSVLVRGVPLSRAATRPSRWDKLEAPRD
jgi:hypothetical protein